MDSSDQKYIDFINWWDGWDKYEDLSEEGKAYVDEFLTVNFPEHTTKDSPKRS